MGEGRSGENGRSGTPREKKRGPAGGGTEERVSVVAGSEWRLGRGEGKKTAKAGVGEKKWSNFYCRSFAEGEKGGVGCRVQDGETKISFFIASTAIPERKKAEREEVGKEKERDAPTNSLF